MSSGEDFLNDILPYVEKHYRVLTDRPDRAVAGLSMGGAQTLGIAMSHLDRFAFIGVFSSGIFGGAAGSWEGQRQKTLDDAAPQKGLKLLWFSTGSEDFVSERHQGDDRDPEEAQLQGGLQGERRRSHLDELCNYLHEFAPQLFQSDSLCDEGDGKEPGKDEGEKTRVERRSETPGRVGDRGPRDTGPCRSRGPPYCRSCRPCPPSMTPRSTPRTTSPTARSSKRPTRITPGRTSECTSTCRRTTRTNADARYPVLYLNHGGGDDDSAWTGTDPRRGGYTHFILDNLIAAKKAKPMIVVMPNTSGIASPNPPKPGEDDACSKEFLKDIIPYVEGHYRAKPGRRTGPLPGCRWAGSS